MSKKFKGGDKVIWKYREGQSLGTIEAYLTESEIIDGNPIDASKDGPRHLIKNDRI